MTDPAVDIIVPVWNQPFETRACLVSILNTSKSARIIIVNNGSSRETERMLEDFSDGLGERAVYMSTERNIGFVPAVNRALARVESEWAMILRSNTIVSDKWLDKMTAVTNDENSKAGIISPATAESLSRIPCQQIETCDISFSGLMLSRKMYEETGFFDEELDGSSWCLKDFQQRAASFGYLTVLAPSARIIPGHEVLFGSEERRKKMETVSIATVKERWGTGSHFVVYMPKESEETYLNNAIKDILLIARMGHHVTVFLHSKQYQAAYRSGWNCLHTGIEIEKIPSLFPNRAIAKRIQQIKDKKTEIEIVKGIDGIPVPGFNSSIPFAAIQKLAKEPRR